MGLLVVRANTVSLAAEDFRVTIRSYDCPSTVSYVGPGGTELDFAGDDVVTTRTPIGDWFTVTTASDRPRTYWCTLLSVLIPLVGFHGSDWNPTPVTSVAIETSQPSDMSMPGKQYSSYRTISLSGHASMS